MEEGREHDNETIKPSIPNISNGHGVYFGRLCINGTR
jgi:hypothetical protein